MLSFPIPSDRPTPRTMDPADRLFRHKRKPEWGIGLWVEEERTRRRMRFEDGELRIFKKGFYHLFKPVDPDRVEVDEVFEALASEQERARADRERANSRAEKPPVMAFPQQIQVFERLFGGGFQAPDYLEAHRHVVSGSRKKAHLDVGVALAAEQLSKANLQALVEAGDFEQLHAHACAVLGSTSLVAPRRDVTPFVEIPADKKELVGRTLFALLHGEERYRKRFREWCRVLRRECGLEARWRMATALPALVHPDLHVCVRRRVSELQARSVKPGTVLSKRPTAIGYRKARRIAKLTQRRLSKAGLEPRDLLDVQVFSWETLRPKGQKQAEAL